MMCEEKTPFDYLAEKEDFFFLDLALCTLTGSERQVIELRFFENMTLKAVGNSRGVGSERIRQVEARGLRKMRHPRRMFIYEDCCLKYWECN